jgi:predicted transcriptional regulator
MVMESQTIRINKKTHDALRDLAAKSNTTMSAVVEAAILEYQRRKYWEEYYAAYEALKASPEAWAEHQEEMKLWDATLTDGLKDWPYEQGEE